MTNIVSGLRRIAEEGYRFAGDAADEIERLRTENATLVEDMNRLRNNNMALLAKITKMEKQAPVGEIRYSNSTGNYVNSVVWVPMAVGAKLYSLPGAKGE